MGETLGIPVAGDLGANYFHIIDPLDDLRELAASREVARMGLLMANFSLRDVCIDRMSDDEAVEYVAWQAKNLPLEG